MSEQNLGPWPTIPVVAPKRGGSPLEGAVLKPGELDEAETFYHETLVPQLACTPDGHYPPHPTRARLEQWTVVGVRRDGELVGAWLVTDDGQLLYPCAVLDDIAGIFRALWDATRERFDFLWGRTDNPTIMAFAQKAIRVPPSPNSPSVVDDRIEWRRPT